MKTTVQNFINDIIDKCNGDTQMTIDFVDTDNESIIFKEMSVELGNNCYFMQLNSIKNTPQVCIMFSIQ